MQMHLGYYEKNLSAEMSFGHLNAFSCKITITKRYEQSMNKM